MTGATILQPKLLQKPWGRDDLPSRLVGDCKEAVGEIWFQPPAPLDSVLTKYLFTSAKLSVQVHPRGSLSPTGRGKDECWLILEAQPGARLATGFRQDIEASDIRQAALDGTIEDLLDWREVAANDFLYVPSGTVHAMGPGLTLVEVQQNTDITYRLYDYGRDRPLHLDDAVKSALGTPHQSELRRHIDPEMPEMLVSGPYFSLAQITGPKDETILAEFVGPVQIVPLEGECSIGSDRIAAGGSAMALCVEDVDFSNCQRCLVAGLPLRS
jgi:mannose-6-phosphate isomerase